MPASASFLSSPQYGYDFVVATTQESINATMLAFLASRQEPVVNICYTADKNGNPQPIAYDALKQAAQGSDPFALPANIDLSNNTDFNNLLKARFMFGFRAQIGIPSVSDPSSLPKIVTLGSDTSSVLFNLFCSEFTVVDLNPGSGYAPPSWTRSDQPTDHPWIFQSRVDLRLSTVSSTAYSTLPDPIQAQIKNMSGSAFSVQQLLFDLANARLASQPDLIGIDNTTTAYQVLKLDFIGRYFGQMAIAGQPLLGCSVVPQSASTATMTITNLNLEVSPYVGTNGQPDPSESDLATLNYLCAADGASLPPAVPFSWNWVDQTDAGDHHGVLAINRTTFVNYFREQLKNYVSNVCIAPSVQVYQQGLTTYYKWLLQPGQIPGVALPNTGNKVLGFTYGKKSFDEAGDNGALGAMSLDSEFTLDLTFSGNTITIVQHLSIQLYAKYLATDATGNVFDKTITDVYTLAVNAQGQLVASAAAPVVDDKSINVNTNAFINFFTDFNSLTADVKTSTTDFVSQGFHSVPVSTVQSYIFPGGQTFLFKDAVFSNNQDLTALITYADLTKPVTVPPTAM